MKENKLITLVEKYIIYKINNEKHVSIINYYNYPEIIYDGNDIIYNYI